MVNKNKDEIITVGIIPARGGSKGVPKKNIHIVAGKPLIAWTIETALRCSDLDRVVVSTDSEDIARVARDYGAEAPFLRPAELAQDDTPGIDPILHAVRWLYEHENYEPDFVAYLQPTSPLRTMEDIEAAIEFALQKNADAVISVTSASHHPYCMQRVNDEGQMRDFMTLEKPVTRRQDFPPLYIENGVIYLVRRSALIEQETFYTDKTYAYVMPPDRSLDIDTSWDLHVADLILQDMLNRGEYEGD